MTDFIWPSDMDRAESEELSRVCEYLDQVLSERDEYRGHLAQICEMLGETPSGQPDIGAVWEGVNAMLDYNNRLKLQMEAVKRQRNELSAQNEKLKAALIDFAETVDMLDDHTHPNIECDAVACSMREAANADPAASLAEIKAQAIEAACKEVMPGPPNPPDDPPQGYQEYCEGIYQVSLRAKQIRKEGK